jgi:hypothetical protein
MKGILLLSAPLALLLLLNGCGMGEPATGQVTGKVLVGGEPLRSGTITFVDAQHQRAYSGISPEGKYRVSKLAPGPAQITLVNHPPTPFSSEPPMGATRTIAYEVRTGEHENDLVFEP